LIAIHALHLQHATFIAYWVILGVLSSVGLGSGLHTFVLFLGPHILRIATTALRFGSTDFSARIDSYFKVPGTLDVAGLSEAFSPNYAHDAWVPQGHNLLVEGAEGAAAGAHDASAADRVSFLTLLLKVAWPAICWGAGTALGELPPYFIARAARQVRDGDVCPYEPALAGSTEWSPDTSSG
jgi:hypothetical protein